MSPETLKPCPFCGHVGVEVTDTENSQVVCICNGCGAGIISHDGGDYPGDEDQNGITEGDRQAAHKAWNSRAATPAGPSEREKALERVAALAKKYVYAIGQEGGNDGDELIRLEQALAALEAERDRLAEAVGVCLDGWIGQHEMGELWCDEVADMEALGRALAALRRSKPSAKGAGR